MCATIILLTCYEAQNTQKEISINKFIILGTLCVPKIFFLFSGKDSSGYKNTKSEVLPITRYLAIA